MQLQSQGMRVNVYAVEQPRDAVDWSDPCSIRTSTWGGQNKVDTRTRTYSTCFVTAFVTGNSSVQRAAVESQDLNCHQCDQSSSLYINSASTSQHPVHCYSMEVSRRQTVQRPKDRTLDASGQDAVRCPLSGSGPPSEKCSAGPPSRCGCPLLALSSPTTR